MFILDLSETYKWPVSISFPVDGGKYKEHKITLEYKRIPASKIAELGQSEGISDIDYVKQIVVGWDLKDKDGEPLDFNDDNLTKLVNIPGAGAAIAQAFYESVTGAAKRKN